MRVTSGARPGLPRPHDRAGRRRRAAEDAERDRADDPARRPDDHLPDRGRRPSPASPAMPAATIPVAMLAALLITLIPTTIAALLSAIGIAGMDRLVRFNVLAKSGRAVEAAGDIDVLLLDKTGTITIGDRQATEFRAAAGVSEHELAEAALSRQPGRRDARRPLDRRARAREISASRDAGMPAGAEVIPFTAQTRISGVKTRRHADPEGRGRFRSCEPIRRPGEPPPRPNCAASPTRSPAPAARRWRSPKMAGCSARSSSRTSSRPACASASPNCAGWASAR